MSDTFINLAYFCIGYVMTFQTYLVYKEYFRPRPLSFLELFMYVESVIERILKTAFEDREEIVKQILNSELRTYDRLRETIKKMKNDDGEAKR